MNLDSGPPLESGLKKSGGRVKEDGEEKGKESLRLFCHENHCQTAECREKEQQKKATKKLMDGQGKKLEATHTSRVALQGIRKGRPGPSARWGKLARQKGKKVRT